MFISCSDLLFLALCLQQALISVVLQTPQLSLQLLSFSLCSVELLLRLLSEPPQSALLLLQQTLPHHFLWSRAAKHGYIRLIQKVKESGSTSGNCEPHKLLTFSETSLSVSSWCSEMALRKACWASSCAACRVCFRACFSRSA